MPKNRCECPHNSETPKRMEYLYSDAEKVAMNHKPGECKGFNGIKHYITPGGEKVWLCSACNLSGYVEVKHA